MVNYILCNTLFLAMIVIWVWVSVGYCNGRDRRHGCCLYKFACLKQVHCNGNTGYKAIEMKMEKKAKRTHTFKHIHIISLLALIHACGPYHPWFMFYPNSFVLTVSYMPKIGESTISNHSIYR